MLSYLVGREQKYIGNPLVENLLGSSSLVPGNDIQGGGCVVGWLCSVQSGSLAVWQCT